MDRSGTGGGEELLPSSATCLFDCVNNLCGAGGSNDTRGGTGGEMEEGLPSWRGEHPLGGRGSGFWSGDGEVCEFVLLVDMVVMSGVCFPDAMGCRRGTGGGLSSWSLVGTRWWSDVWC